MKKITKYGLKIQQDFLEKCKQDGTYQRVFEDHEEGYCILEESINTLQDAVAWCLLSYETDAIIIVNEWLINGTGIAWTFEIKQIIDELEKCIK